MAAATSRSTRVATTGSNWCPTTLRFCVDGESVVENPGVHSPILATGQINRPAGAYPVVLRHIQAGGELALNWRMRGEGRPRRKPVAADNLATQRTSLSALRGRGSFCAWERLWPCCGSRRPWIIGGGLSRLIVWMNREQPGWMFHPLVPVLALSFGLVGLGYSMGSVVA